MNFSLKAFKLLTILSSRILVILSVDFHSASQLYTFYFVTDTNP